MLRKKILILSALLLLTLSGFSAGTLTLGGSITTAHNEQDVIDGGKTIIFELTGATFIATAADSLNAWKAAFSSSIVSATNFDLISSGINPGDITFINDTAISISFPGNSAYAIWTNETVTVTIPSSLLATGSPVPGKNFTVTNQSPLITINAAGTLSTSHLESDIVGGGKTIILDLSRDNWAVTLGGSNSVTDHFKAAITGSSSSGIVNDSITVVRTSDTRVTITFNSNSGYYITADEDISFAFQSDAFRGSTVASNTPTQTITDINPVVTISGTAIAGLLESDIRSATTYTVNFDVKYDRWQGNLGNNNTNTDAFLAALSGSFAWSANLSDANLNANSTRATLVIPQISNYAISTNETVTMIVPAAAFLGSATYNLGTVFTVTNQNATVNTSWSTGGANISESKIRTGGDTLTIDITSGDSWITNATNLTARIKSGLSGGGGTDWDNYVVPGITVTRVSATKVRAILPVPSGYQITVPQVVTFNFPDNALNASSGAVIIASPSNVTIVPETATATITPDPIKEEDLNGSFVTIVLSEDTFSDFTTLAPGNFTLSKSPPSTSISSVTGINAGSAKIYLSYTGDISVNTPLEVTVSSAVLAGGTSIISNTVSVTALLEPIITGVSIPNDTFKINDVVPVTITVQNDAGSSVSFTSNSVGGRSITYVGHPSANVYTASFVLLAGSGDIAAGDPVPVSVQLQVSGRPGNLWTTPIVQPNDLLDATAPKIFSFQALGTSHKIGDNVQLMATADGAGYKVVSSRTLINGVPYSPKFTLISQSGGSYFFSYQVSSGDTDVSNLAPVTGKLVLSDAAGNTDSLTVTANSPSTFVIDAHAPIISSVTAPDSLYIPGETIILTITADGPSYTLAPESFINGISATSGRITLSGAGPVYSLNYPVLNGDAPVSQGNLPVSIQLKDAAGNLSSALTSFANNVSVYTTKPTASTSGSRSICAGDSATLFVNLTGSPKWNIIVSDGTATMNFNGISNSPFSFKVAPNTTKTYSVVSVTDKNGLSNTGSGGATVTVHQADPADINLANGTAYNVNGSSVLLTATPSGGVFSGPGVVSSQNRFYPNIAGVLLSPHKIFYSYTNTFGCVSRDSVVVNVVEASGDLVLKDIYCYNDAPFTVEAHPDSIPIVPGSFKLTLAGVTIPGGSGITDNGNNTATLSPALLAPGDYLLTYKYFVNVELTLEANFTIESVDQPKFVGFPDPATICENSAPINLLGNAKRGNFTGSSGITGNSTIGFKFDPSITGPGINTIIYSDTTLNGCRSIISKTLRVLYVPEMGFQESDNCVLSVPPYTSINFTNTTADKDSIRSWAWNFDDVNSGADNFSTLVSPSHVFNKSGKYSISLLDTAFNGCTDRHEITLDFGDKPTGTFAAENKCFSPGTPTKFISSTASNDGIKSYNWKIHLPGGATIDTTINYVNASSAEFRFQFENEGAYIIEHQVTSNTNCTLDFSNEVILKPTVIMQSGVPYEEDFNDNKGSWSSSYIIGKTILGADSLIYGWMWGVPGFADLDGKGKGWYTNRVDSTISQFSYMESPCFNLSALERPMIKMDIFRNFKNYQDATLLKYSTDNGSSWNILGNPGDGINWYSDYQASNYSYGTNYGWANTASVQADTGWVEARHIIDILSGTDNVQFRMEFGAKDNKISDYEGFAMQKMTVAERSRFSVLEHFTNTTAVNPVRDKAKTANTKVNALYKDGLLYKDFVKLEYHTRFPSATDPFNVFNRDVPGARAFYYGVTSVPYSILDGGNRSGRRFDFTDTKFEPKTADINIRSLEDPAVAITLNAIEAGNNLSINASLKALQNLPSDERVLYVVLYETLVTGVNAGNGETQFQNVVRAMLPDADGTPVNQILSASPGDTTVLNFSYNADLSNLKKENIRVAAYLQNDFTGEIYQAALSDYSRSKGTPVSPVLTYTNRISVYPNPATDYVEISIERQAGKSASIQFFDQLGRMAYEQELNPDDKMVVVNTEIFNKGIYYIRYTEKGVQQSEMLKLVIMN
ncbi:MAG: hypothetical protein H6538_03160 [Bacteroidales bacterium]|nr:hypothetical protein [Bacteroidales bacterium]MCB9000242.1 hypothetical protein [Bacteroidales bacterium]MCB9013361.1 hypothetical protein [Bacteroidales bacterium]